MTAIEDARAEAERRLARGCDKRWGARELAHELETTTHADRRTT